MRFLVLMAEEDHFDTWEATTEPEQRRLRGLRAFTEAVRERGRSSLGEALDRPERARGRVQPATRT